MMSAAIDPVMAASAADSYTAPPSRTTIPILKPAAGSTFLPGPNPPQDPENAAQLVAELRQRLPTLLTEAQELVDAAALKKSTDDNNNSTSPETLKVADDADMLTDASLIRFLRSRSWDVSKAAVKLKETLVWRCDYKPHKITPAEVESEALAGNIYVNGFDKHGRPIIYLKKSTRPHDFDLNVRLLVLMLEHAIKAIPEGCDSGKVCLILDMAGYSRANSPPLAISRQTLNILTGHYPERLGVAYVVNAPWIFGTLWSVVSPFLDPVTKSKIRFVNLNNQASSASSSTSDFVGNDAASIKTATTQQTATKGSFFRWGSSSSTESTAATKTTKATEINALFEVIDQDMLEDNYGGTLAFTYNHEQYFNL
ncbi:hypothetical protein HDV05_003406 [Chytridiales sp. JEL 0842]|nr:hypothetical protein HDV05_003406 [Chytridiales sp. JEL 0842]